jgi:hypothetical protein
VIVATGVLIGAATQSQADLALNLDQVYTGEFSPGGTAPWLKIIVTDTGTDEVSLKFEAGGLTSDMFLTSVYMNYTGSPSVLTFGNDPTIVGAMDEPSIGQGSDAFKAPGDGKFDLVFDFETSNAGGGTKRFGAGESITYVVTGEDLDPSDFNALSAPDGGAGPFIAVAHLQGVEGTIGSSHIYATVVPEPTTMIAGALLLLPFGASALRLRRKS